MGYKDQFQSQEGKRLLSILTNPKGLNNKSREQFEAIFDEKANGLNIEGIDRVRSKIFKKLFTLTDQQWKDATGLPIREGLIVSEYEGPEWTVNHPPTGKL